MISFKQYLKESEPTPTPAKPPSDIGNRDIPPGVSDAVYNVAGMMSTTKGYVSGFNPNSIPYGYRSYGAYANGLSPGESNQSGRVNGGGGFEIEKASRDYLINLAKRYGVDIETQESMQQKQQQQQQANMPGGQQPEEQQDHLINQVKMHPAMYLLNQDQNLQKHVTTALKSMQDWKLTKNPDAQKDWYTIWKEKYDKNEEQHKMNLSRMATAFGSRERTSEIHHRLTHSGLLKDKNTHIKNYLDPQNHYPQLQDQQTEEPENYEYGFEYGDTE